MIIRATGILHFAQGDVMMMGSMAGLTAALLVPAATAFDFDRGNGGRRADRRRDRTPDYRNLRNRGVPLMNIITATLGMSILLVNIARLIWGVEPMRYPPMFSNAAYQFGELRIAPQLFWIMVMSVVLMGLLQLFLRHTRTGIAMQAAAQDPEAAQIMGVNLTRTRAYTFGIGGMLAGAAGVMLGSMFFAYFEMGFVTGIKGFVAATLGGLGSIGGAMVGGIVFGLIETYSAVFISSAYKDAIGMVLLILLLFDISVGARGGVAARSSVNSFRSQFVIGVRQAPTFAILLIGALLPLLANLDPYMLHLLSAVAIGSILALGLQLLLGGAGLLSIGQAAFYGVGAYTSALLTLKLNQPFFGRVFVRRRHGGDHQSFNGADYAPSRSLSRRSNARLHDNCPSGAQERGMADRGRLRVDAHSTAVAVWHRNQKPCGHLLSLFLRIGYCCRVNASVAGFTFRSRHQCNPAG